MEVFYFATFVIGIGIGTVGAMIWWFDRMVGKIVEETEADRSRNVIASRRK